MASLKPEQARDLVKHFGSQNEAARQLGIPRTTLQDWLDPIPGRIRKRIAWLQGKTWKQKNVIEGKINQLLYRQLKRTNEHRQQLKELRK